MSENQTFGPPPDGRQHPNSYGQGSTQAAGQYGQQPTGSQYAGAQYQSGTYSYTNPSGTQNQRTAGNPYQAGGGTQTPRAPYYQAPQYARAGQPIVAPPEKKLSNTLALIAFGSMLVAAALGIGISLSGAPGRGLLLGVALCALIAGGVLTYAALKGQRPGWFLVVSIVGAVIAVPVVAVGGAYTTYETISTHETFEDAYGWSTEIDGYDFWDEVTFSDEGWLDYGPSSPLWALAPVETLDPEDPEVLSYGESGELDLTGLRPGVEAHYSITSNDSYTRVLLRKDQLIEVFVDYAEDSMISITDEDFGPLRTPVVCLSGYSASGDIDTEVVNSRLGLSASNAENILSFDISASDALVEFVYVSDDAPSIGAESQTEIESQQSASNESDQG